MNQNLSPLDGVVFFAIFACTLGAVAYGRYRLKHESGTSSVAKSVTENKFELLLMGRKITLPLFIASLVASWYGEITGVTAFTYENGLFSFLTQGVFWYAAYLIFALVLVKKIPQNQASTFPDLVGKHLGPRAHRLSAVLNLVSLLPVAGVLSLGIFIQFLTGWSLFSSSAIGLICIFSYSLSGGLRSVVFADLVQFFAMVIAVLLVVLFAFLHHGSVTHLPALLPAQHLSWSGGKSFSEIMVWGLIAFITLVDPLFYQRTLAAKNTKQAMQGILGATVIWFIIDCATTLGALYARAYLPNLKPNESYFIFSMSVLPSGLRGLFLAGIFAAVVSSLDSHLFSASSIFAFDCLKKENFTKRRLQVSMVGIGVFALLLTPLFEGNIALVWKIMGSLSSACLLFPWLLMMLFPKVKKEFRFMMSVSFGLIFIIFGGILAYFKMTPIDSFYFGLAGSLIGFLFF